MKASELRQLLEKVSNGTTDVNTALDKLKYFSFSDLGYAVIDHHREIRTGYPEIIFCSGKTTGQIIGIIEDMTDKEDNVIATRAPEEVFIAVRRRFPEAEYYHDARIISIRKKEYKIAPAPIAVITAGTSDIPVAEEAAVTAELLGNNIIKIYDAGVAGIHRLIDRLDKIKQCRVVIVIAGMEGALASVVGGLIDKPVIAVPTSVGYGAGFSGLSALLAMLTSCAAGITVVNIDNGFGAGFAASRINHL